MKGPRGLGDWPGVRGMHGEDHVLIAGKIGLVSGRWILIQVCRVVEGVMGIAGHSVLLGSSWQ